MSYPARAEGLVNMIMVDPKILIVITMVKKWRWALTKECSKKDVTIVVVLHMKYLGISLVYQCVGNEKEERNRSNIKKGNDKDWPNYKAGHRYWLLCTEENLGIAS